jgi:anti-anti-sigma factor
MDELMDEGGAAEPEVTVEVSSDGTEAPVIRVVGELDISNVDVLKTAVEPICAEEPERLIFDFGGVRFMDSSTIALLITWSANVCPVEIRNPSRPVRRVIEISGLSSTLHLNP